MRFRDVSVRLPLTYRTHRRKPEARKRLRVSLHPVMIAHPNNADPSVRAKSFECGINQSKQNFKPKNRDHAEVRAPSVVVVLGFASLLLVGCSSSENGSPSTNDAGPDGNESPDGNDAADVTCVDYPDAGYRTFPYEPAPSGDFPTCPLSCDSQTAKAGAGIAPLDQYLPSGPCNDEGAACQSGFMAGWCGPCLDTGGPGNGYFCRCRSGAWHCVLSSQGANICDPPSCIDFASSVDGGSCRDVTLDPTEVCACGTCRPRCEKDADCAAGACKTNALCFPQATCPGPDECPATCTGYCD